MSDDLRERIARALADHNVDASRVGWESRTMGWYRDAADAVLAAVVQPVIEQAEQERDEARESVSLLAPYMAAQVAAEARVATLEAALDRIAHHPITQSSDAVTLRQIARDALDEQDTPVHAEQAEARVVTLEAALAESQDLIRRMAFGGVVVGYEIRDQLDRNGAVLGEQDTAAEPPKVLLGFDHDELHAYFYPSERRDEVALPCLHCGSHHPLRFAHRDGGEGGLDAALSDAEPTP